MSRDPEMAIDLEPAQLLRTLLATLGPNGRDPLLLTRSQIARRIALSAALASGAIGSLLVVHGESWSVFAASSALVGLGSVATPAVVTFLIRNRTSDAAFPFFFTVGTASLGLGQLSGPAVGGLLADWFGPSAIGWFAAAIYSAGMLAAAADGFFGRR